mgnify:CR=1 FL=1
MNRKPIIAANWKMNKTATEAVEFIEEFENLIGGSSSVDIAIAPAFIALSATKELLINSVTTGLAAQNCHLFGAQTHWNMPKSKTSPESCAFWSASRTPTSTSVSPPRPAII